jgi:pimeloyl-ACP methyl ester carboxylesterase
VAVLEIDNNGVNIHVETAGEGRPVVLVHGFPDSGALWRHQVPALVDAGFHVIVPDLRGFGASGVPPEVADYSILYAIDDIVAVLDHLGVALSVGQASAFRSVGVPQLEKSWYMFFFQFSGVAEEWLSADGWSNFRAWCHHPDADVIVGRWEATGTLTAALNWYRANIPPDGFVAPPLDLPPVEAPTLGVWSSGDFALTEEQMARSGEYVSGPWRYERVEGPGHWMQLEAPDEVNRLLLDFLPS